MLEVQSTPDTTAYFPRIACSRVLPSFLPSSSHSLSCSSHHQHYTSLCKTEGMECMGNHIEDLLGTHRLAILTQMKLLTVYHVSDLLTTHSSVWGGQAIHYGFFYLHMTKIHNNIHIFAPLAAGFIPWPPEISTVGILVQQMSIKSGIIKAKYWYIKQLETKKREQLKLLSFRILCYLIDLLSKHYVLPLQYIVTNW